MRLMQYRLQLEEDEGYIISNAPPELGGGIISSEQLRGPGIRMTLELASPSPDKIFEQFKFNEVWENPAFRACYQQSLRGEKTDWKLVSIEVMCGYLSMEFASEKRYQEFEESNDHDSDSPYYNESVYLSLKGQDYVRLRFDVERVDGLGFEVYKVDISPKHTKVTEFIGHQKRVIDFLPSTPDESDSHKPHQWVKVSSYC